MSLDGLAPGQNNPYVAAARQDAARERARVESQSGSRAPPPDDRPVQQTARVRELRV
jgi:hypothetical protein